MIVYRVIRDTHTYDISDKVRNELKDYLSFKISVPKKEFNHGLNTHNYENNINYLHFFHFLEDAISYIQSIPSMGWDGRDYIAFYNIPDILLEKYCGFGLYPEKSPFNTPVLEYALPYSMLDNSFIINKIINYCNLSYEEKSNYSCEYKNYIAGGYQLYLDNLNIDEGDKKLIKIFMRHR